MPFIAVFQQGPVIAARYPLQEYIDIRLEPDRNARLPHVVAGFTIDEGPAAGRDYPRFALEEARNNTALAVAKRLFAVAREYFLDRAIGCRFDFVIRIDKPHPEFAGKPGTDTGFPGPHQSDQDDGFVRGKDLRRGFGGVVSRRHHIRAGKEEQRLRSAR